MQLDDATRTRLMELFAAFPPTPIRTEEDMDQAQAVVDGLLGLELDAAEEIYLNLLGTLIYAYELEHVEMPELGGTDLVRELMRFRDLTQRDLVRAGIFATDSVASEVLAGKRPLTVDQVRGLARFFRMPADAFLRLSQAA